MKASSFFLSFGSMVGSLHVFRFVLSAVGFNSSRLVIFFRPAHGPIEPFLFRRIVYKNSVKDLERQIPASDWRLISHGFYPINSNR